MHYFNVASDFSIHPGGRYKNQGPFSGEEFFEVLVNLFETHDKFTISLDGVRGYTQAFLDEAFGRLITKTNLTRKDVNKRMEIATLEFPDDRYIIEDIIKIEDARKKERCAVHISYLRPEIVSNSIEIELSLDVEKRGYTIDYMIPRAPSTRMVIPYTTWKFKEDILKPFIKNAQYKINLNVTDSVFPPNFLEESIYLLLKEDYISIEKLKEKLEIYNYRDRTCLKNLLETVVQAEFLEKFINSQKDILECL